MSADDLARIDGALNSTAPLPRANGELVFEEVWQGRALGMGVVALKRLGVSWSDFRNHLAAAIAAHEGPPEESAASAYYCAWLDAVEAQVLEACKTPKIPG